MKPLANAGGAKAMVSITASGRTPRGGNGTPLWYSGLENSMGRGGWRATVHGTAKSWTHLKLLSTHTQLIIVRSSSEYYSEDEMNWHRQKLLTTLTQCTHNIPNCYPLGHYSVLLSTNQLSPCNRLIYSFHV